MWIHSSDDASQARAAKTGSYISASKRQTVVCQPIDVWGLNDLVPHKTVIRPRMIVGDNHDNVGAVVRKKGNRPHAKRECQKDFIDKFQGGISVNQPQGVSPRLWSQWQPWANALRLMNNPGLRPTVDYMRLTAEAGLLAGFDLVTRLGWTNGRLRWYCRPRI